MTKKRIWILVAVVLTIPSVAMAQTEWVDNATEAGQ